MLNLIKPLKTKTILLIILSLLIITCVFASPSQAKEVPTKSYKLILSKIGFESSENSNLIDTYFIITLPKKFRDTNIIVYTEPDTSSSSDSGTHPPADYTINVSANALKMSNQESPKTFNLTVKIYNKNKEEIMSKNLPKPLQIEDDLLDTLGSFINSIFYTLMSSAGPPLIIRTHCFTTRTIDESSDDYETLNLFRQDLPTDLADMGEDTDLVWKKRFYNSYKFISIPKTDVETICKNHMRASASAINDYKYLLTGNITDKVNLKKLKFKIRVIYFIDNARNIKTIDTSIKRAYLNNNQSELRLRLLEGIADEWHKVPRL